MTGIGAETRRQTPLLEREAQLEALRGGFADAKAGAGHLVLVEGEAGVGKSALLRAFRDEVGVATRVLEGACDPLATPRPLGPLADVAAATGGELERLIDTRHIPDMGWHFMNPALTKFDVTKPPILVYAKRGSGWQLVAFEWVFPEKPAKKPLPGAKYGSFAAACHYADGTFVASATEADCARTSPETGAAFGFWHPDLVTLHLWLWYPNPDGVYAGPNPLMRPFNS